MQSRLDLVDDWESRAEASGYSATKMALELGVTLRSLETFFRGQFGMGPHDWMVRLRMSHAVSLLAMGKPVRIVSLKVGYKQVSHFSREFKRYFGLPPARYVLVEMKTSSAKKPASTSRLDNNFASR